MTTPEQTEREALADRVYRNLDPEGYGWGAGDHPSVDEVIVATVEELSRNPRPATVSEPGPAGGLCDVDGPTLVSPGLPDQPIMCAFPHGHLGDHSDGEGGRWRKSVTAEPAPVGRDVREAVAAILHHGGDEPDSPAWSTTPETCDTCRRMLDLADAILARFDVTPRDGDTVPARYRIEGTWLVREVSHHTCGTASGGHYGAHEPGCGLEPELNLSTLPGWNERDGDTVRVPSEAVERLRDSTDDHEVPSATMYAAGAVPVVDVRSFLAAVDAANEEEER